MAMIGFRVPAETARVLSEIDVPGKLEDVAHYHVTLMVLGKDLPISTIALATIAAYEVAANTRPFTIQTSRISSFPSDEDVPIIARCESNALHDLWVQLCESLDVHGIDYNKKFPEYKPHVTLSYAKEGIEDIRIPTLEWGAHELILWGGDEGDRRILVAMPFSLMSRAATVRKVAVGETLRQAQRVELRYRLSSAGISA
jgi:2'-5' RNA ligase